MSFISTCPYCGQRYEMDDYMSGRTVSCSECGKAFILPVNDEAVGNASDGRGRSGAANSDAKHIISRCPFCGQQYEVDAAMHGQSVTCSKCANSFVILVDDDAVEPFVSAGGNGNGDPRSPWSSHRKKRRRAGIWLFLSAVVCAAAIGVWLWLDKYPVGAEAQYKLGLRYEKGDGVEKNLQKAAEWYQKAAEQGHAGAQCHLGACYYKGNGVPRDLKQAFYWYRKAAEQGHAKAQCLLGVCYCNGEGVPRDLKQAFYWYRKAAEQGHAGAQCLLGACYELGEGIPKNSKQAFYWYRKAAEQGHAKAQWFLGGCYESGEGVPKDLAQAVYWYRKSAEQGDDYAREALKRLGY